MRTGFEPGPVKGHDHDVRALFRNCRVIGRRFRLAHVLFAGGKIIEVATFRRDPRDGHLEQEDAGGEGSTQERIPPQRRQDGEPSRAAAG